MGFSDWLLGRPDIEERAAALPLTSNDLLTVLAPNSSTSAGVSVSETSAPKSTAVFRAIALLSGAIASLPLKTYRSAEAGRVETDSPLLARPHPTYTRFELLELMAVHLLLSGNAYCVKVRNGFGEVGALLPIMPTLVTPKLHADGTKTWEVPGIDGSRKEVGPDVILHIPGMGYDGVRGWSPIALCRQAIGAGLAAEEFSARFFSNGSHLGGVLQTDSTLTAEQAKDAKQTFAARTQGLAKAHEVAVLSSGLRYEPIGIAPEDSQLIESRAFAIQDVARIYGLPPHLLADSSNSTSWGSGLSEQTRALLVYTLGPWLSRIEDRLTRELALPGEYFEFTRSGLLQSTTLERYEVYKIGIETGVLTANECRALENLPALPERTSDGVSLIPTS